MSPVHNREHFRALRTQQRARHSPKKFTFHAEAVLVIPYKTVPNSQRSTHELTTAGHSPAKWLWTPEEA
jgi:hypothetical protein